VNTEQMARPAHIR